MSDIPIIKPIQTKEYETKQSKYNVVSKLPLRSIVLGPSGSGKSILLQNLKSMAKMGRPKFVMDWDQFDSLCSLQATLVEISEFFKVSEDTIENRVNNFIDSIDASSNIIQQYHLSPSNIENQQVTSIRTFQIVYGSNLDNIMVSAYELDSLLDSPTSLVIDDTKINNVVDVKHYYEFATNTINNTKHGLLGEETIFDESLHPRCFFYPHLVAQIVQSYENSVKIKNPYRTMEYPTEGKKMLFPFSDEVNKVFISTRKHKENLLLQKYEK